jgi:probable selenate reductase FAD-binding subunit
MTSQGKRDGFTAKGDQMPRVRKYLRPDSVREALDMMKTEPGKGGWIAGGTFLGMARRIPYEYLVDITALGLDTIKRKRGALHIGAAVSIQDLAVSPLVDEPGLRALGQAACSVAGRQIRNMATVAGDLVSGYLLVDLPPALLVLDAELVLEGASKDRVSLRDFYSAQVLRGEKGWLVTGVVVPVPARGSRSCFIKFARTRNDVAILDVACLVRMQQDRFQDVRVAVGATLSRPTRLTALEDFLRGRPASDEVLAEAAGMAPRGLSLMDNMRGSRTYRAQMLGVFVNRVLRSCLAEQDGDRERCTSN